jgi:CCS family citrate carrier protein
MSTAAKLNQENNLLNEDEKGYKIMGLSLPAFGILALVIMIAVYLGKLPGGLVGAIPFMMVLGAVLDEIGNHTPIIKDYFGGGPIVIIFGSAALFTYGIIPQATTDVVVAFTKGGGFLSFYIAALITGSILGMDRKLLIKASARYLPAILGGVAVALGLVGIFGALIGFGFKEAVLYIGIPIMGGGMGAGAVPLSEMFGEFFSMDVGKMLSVMIPALAMGNAMAIVAAGLLDKYGKKNPKMTGNGKLMRIQSDDLTAKEITDKISYELMGIGMLMATTFFVWGKILAKFIPIHSYALMIISVAIVKAIGILPRKYEIGAFQFFRFVMITLTPALLIGIGAAYTDLAAVISAFTIQYVVLVAITIIGSIIGSGFVGYFMGFYPIESAITAGLCMANMGGTGDVAVLSAAKRMELMPFAQISSRLGGAFIIILASSLLKIFL